MNRDKPGFRHRIQRRLPVLMYHQVHESRSDGLTLSVREFTQQIEWLRGKGYETIRIADLKRSAETGSPLPSRPLIITFDDAYTSFGTLAFPILERVGFCSTLFVPVAYMGKTNIWDQGNEPILRAEEIRTLHMSGLVEIGIHSFLHQSYARMPVEAMKEDLEQCFSTLQHYSIPASRVMAYPYGAFPRKDPGLLAEMKALFAEQDLWYALRIGNRLNRLPIRDPYEVQRIDIRGDHSFAAFRRRVRFGKQLIPIGS